MESGKFEKQISITGDNIDIHGSENCCNCGRIIKAGVKFCNFCGSKVYRNIKICIKCGTIIDEGEFCPECGNKYKNEEDVVRCYIWKLKSFVEYISELVETWHPSNGEFDTHQYRLSYSVFMKKVIDNTDPESDKGRELLCDMENVSNVLKEICKVYPEIRINKIRNYDVEITEDMEIFINGEYKTWPNFFVNSIMQEFHDKETSHTKARYSLRYLDEYPYTSSYMTLQLSFQRNEYYKEAFVELLEKIESQYDNGKMNDIYEIIYKYPISFEESVSDKYGYLYRRRPIDR